MSDGSLRDCPLFNHIDVVGKDRSRVRGEKQQREAIMISRITMSTLAAAALALGVSASAHAAPATSAVGAGVKTAVLNGVAPGEGVQQVHWRRHHWYGYRNWGYRRHYWRRWW
jgi:hypothetical protein